MAENGKLAWTNEKRLLSELIPWPRNPRQVKVDQVRRLQESLTEFGQPETIAIGPGNELYNGHQRLKSWADKFGDIEVDVRIASRELTEKEREKLTIFLHKGAAGEWDFDTLANEFDVDDLLDWGFDEHELDLDLWGVEPEEDPGAQIDRAEELRELWGVETGQLWRLGEHRLISGDCTDAEVVARLMDGEKYDSMITDPPFFTPATHYQSRVKHQRKFSDLSALAGFWELVLKTTDEYRKDSAHVVVFCNCDSYAVFYPVMFSWFDKTKSLVWDKKHVGLGRIFRHQHELMVWGRNQDHYFEPNGNLYADVMPFEATPSKDREHPVEKPAELLAWIIEPLTPGSGIVLDPFGGAGPALIAAEQLGRRCRYIDKDPAYCAVAIQRWVDMTGGEPELVNSYTVRKQ